jgi:transposase
MKQVKTLSFSEQDIYCGIDVHKKNWAVCIRDDERELKTFSQPPRPEILADFLKRNYPQANFHAVYEAGFCGYWIQQVLSQQGIHCIITHAADVPTTDKDRRQKTDVVDCRKLAQALGDGSLKGIYIPSQQSIEDRSVMRTREQLVQDQTRYKNRIQSWLHFFGIAIPEGYKKTAHFSRRFISWLEQLALSESAKISLQLKLDALQSIRRQLLLANQNLRILAQSDRYQKQVELLCSIPGIGLTNAMIFLMELEDINRFSTFDQLCSYAGLKPDIYSSSDTVIIKGITHRCNPLIRGGLVESAWKTISKDPALLIAYKEYKKRMNYNNAIIRIAKKLLRRIRYVLLHQTPYVTGIVQ